MRFLIKNITPFVAASVLFLTVLLTPVWAQSNSEDLDVLYEQLLEPVDGNWQDIEKRIWKAWSKSGSDAMDLLLQRGRQAMKDGDLEKAVEHLTALTDHAPEFAEGWNARATVFFMMDEFGLSVADIQTTLALNPHHFGALSGLGMIFEQLDRPEAALEAYKAAKKMHPHRPNLGQAIERLEEKTKGTSL
jgi:tetratricopeptide (TPR) repeat protein